MNPRAATVALSDKPRRVLLCHNFYREPGGEDQVFADEGWLLESRGHEVIRYTRHNNEMEGMGRWEAARRTLWNRQTYDEIGRLIRQERPDVLHCHNTFPLISPSIYQAANEAGIPVVQTLHNYRLLCPAAVFLRDGRPCEDCLGKLLAWPGIAHGCYRGNRPATAVVAAMLAVHRLRGTWHRGVQQFIALSEFSRGKFVEGGLPADRISTKPNFVRVDRGAGSGRGGYALFVGRLSREKGIHTLLEAWQRHDLPVPLKIVGDGPLAPAVRAAAGRDGIQWLGRRSPDEILAIMAEAQCLVFPSICSETFGRTIIEAYSTGTPVIATNMASTSQLVADGRTGYHFEAGNSADLAAKIRRLASAGIELIEMRQAARHEFEEKYTCDVNYVQLVEVYRRAAALRGTGGNSQDWLAGCDRLQPQATSAVLLSQEGQPGLATIGAAAPLPRGHVP